MKTKVFVSFDYEHDENIKKSLVNQSKQSDSPFSINDVSIQEPVTNARWQNKARALIRQSDVMIVLCGEFTDQARGVAAEVTIAQEEHIPYYLIKGRKNKEVKKPLTARNEDVIHKWKWPILKDLITR